MGRKTAVHALRKALLHAAIALPFIFLALYLLHSMAAQDINILP